MKNIYLLVFVLCASSLISCTKGKVKARILDAIPTVRIDETINDSIPHWNLSSNFSVDFFEQEIDSMCLISLQTTEESLIGKISGLYLIENKLFVVDANKAQTIFVFDLQGNYLYQIGSKGEAPGEYSSINQVTVTHEGIAILDWLKWKYISYDLEGNLLFEHTFRNKTPERILRLDEHTFIGSHAGYSEKYPFHLTWFNDKDSVMDTGIPITNPHPASAGSLKYTSVGSILFYYNLCDTIFEISGREVFPKFRLGLYNPGEVSAFLKQTENMDKSDYRKALYDFKDGKITNYYSLLETEDYWIVEHQKGSFVYFSVVDKYTNKSRNYIRTNIAKRKLYIPFIMQSTYKNWLISCIDETFYLELSREDQERFMSHVILPQERELIKKHDIENNNPIICMLRLKR